MSVIRSANLFFREGSADKVYSATLVEEQDGHAVNFEYGRRGKPMKAGSKGKGLTLDAATKIYDKLVQSKIAKGYTEQESGVAFSSAAMAGRSVDFLPQLYNEITDEEARSLGGDWLVQEKHDGERRTLIFDGNNARFGNRRGLETGIQEPVAAAFRRLGESIGESMVLDAEDMSDHVMIFDVPEHFMIENGSFRERAAILAHLQETITDLGLGQTLRVDIPTPAPAFFEKHHEMLLDAGAEGYVIRHADSLYASGRPNSGGDALKVKFWAEATCRVAPGRAGKASIALELQDGPAGAWLPVGNVTVPANQMMPKPGDLVEVRYLYAYDGGSLFQPVLKGLRHDLTEDAAQLDQLKLKKAVPDETASPEP